MKTLLTTWFILCTWLAPVTEHARAQEGTAEWLATGVEYRSVVKHRGSIPLPSSMEDWQSLVMQRIANPSSGKSRTGSNPVSSAFVRDALISSIVVGYAWNSLQDGIAFTKSPQGRDLNFLWHTAKRAHIVMVLATGALNVLSIQRYGWKKTLLFDAIGFTLGVIVWRYSYPMWRKVNWPDFAVKINADNRCFDVA